MYAETIFFNEDGDGDVDIEGTTDDIQNLDISDEDNENQDISGFPKYLVNYVIF